MAQPERPLSPFMQYRWQYTNTLSILHRITGILLSLCFFVLVYWLAAAASGPERYASALATIGSPLVRLLLVGGLFSFSLPPAERHPAPVLGCGLRFRAADRAQDRLGGGDRRARADGGAVDRARRVARRCRMSLRSPLGRVLGLGSAKGGSGHWYSQRVTAVALVILGCWFIASLALLGAGAPHAAVIGWLHSPFSAVMALLLVAVTAYHAQLGLQVVFEDYISDKGTRLVVLVALKFALVVAALIGILAVLRIAFGAQA